MGEASLPLPQPVSERIPPRALAVLPDERLAKMAAEGSPKAFTAIYERHHQALYRYCRSILGNDEDARDALQNTMVAAMRSLPGEKRKIALKAWLFRVAHNEAISLVRKRAATSSIEDAAEIPLEAADEETRDRVRALFADLKQLPERQRGALVMRELNGLGYAEIAAALETSEAGAKQLVYESRASLHELEEGREMECESARKAISARDGRILRGRKVRAHLRACDDCRSFRESIGGRRTQLQALAPPLPGPAAAAILSSILGGGGGSAGGGIAAAVGAGATGSALMGSAAMKAGIIAVAAGIGAGGIGVVMGEDPPFSSAAERNVAGSTAGAGAKGTPAPGGLGGDGAAGQGAGAAAGTGAGAGGGSVNAGNDGSAHDDGGGSASTGAGGTSDGGADDSPSVSDGPAPPGGGDAGGGNPGGGPPASPPGGGGGTPPTTTPPPSSGPIGTPPGQGGVPPGQGGVPPGLSEPPPGLGGTPPGQGGTPPGQQRVPPEVVPTG